MTCPFPVKGKLTDFAAHGFDFTAASTVKRSSLNRLTPMSVPPLKLPALSQHSESTFPFGKPSRVV